ncbi:O-antigen ligase family protein [Bradyrhizobium sp. LLZ17]|uniref:O-antigen ligase family protein n=1 Tax=Bradyrhizobium sp. LLZ17 TaxID=3239388 RepID=A0AB39XM98_9BRAD
MAIWLVVLVPTVDPIELKRSFVRPESFLPAVLFALAVVGLSWTDVDRTGMAQGLGPVVKFAALPLLIYHFQRSPRGEWTFIAFLLSCSALMVLSWIVYLAPNLKIGAAEVPGVPVRNYIDQTQEFALCIFALLPLLANSLRKRRAVAVLGYTVLLMGSAENLATVVVGRTALLYFPVLILLFVWRYLNRYTATLFLCGLICLTIASFSTSTSLRQRVELSIRDYEVERHTDLATSQGLRFFYWRTSLQAIMQAPIFGHGTGSTKTIFANAAKGKEGEWANTVRNPHNQTLYVAVQWGLVGTLLLFAMWCAHVLLFLGKSFAHWLGLIVVTQNILSSLVNSHLFDFNEGWLYVLGVGVAGGAIKNASKAAALSAYRAPTDHQPRLSMPALRAGDASRYFDRVLFTEWLQRASRSIETVIGVSVIFVISASNIYWRWANDWIAVALALGAGWCAMAAVRYLFKRRAYREMRRQYGQEWYPET